MLHVVLCWVSISSEDVRGKNKTAVRCDPCEELFSAVWLWISTDSLSGSGVGFNKGGRSNICEGGRLNTGYKRDQTCDPRTMGLSVIASPPCLLTNIVQTVEKLGIEPHTGYFQVCDLKNSIYKMLETESLLSQRNQETVRWQ